MYLASRSKQGIKLLTILTGESIVTARLTDIKTLKLPQLWEVKIQQLIHENRMLYEPWVESAKNYNELRDRLKNRGFRDLPMGPNPMLDIAAYTSAPKADTSSFKIRRTMIRKAE